MVGSEIQEFLSTPDMGLETKAVLAEWVNATWRTKECCWEVGSETKTEWQQEGQEAGF